LLRIASGDVLSAYRVPRTLRNENIARSTTGAPAATRSEVVFLDGHDRITRYLAHYAAL
jgi:hypothetical protein